MTSAEEFNNQVDRTTFSLDTSQPLSPATPVIVQEAQNGHNQGGRDRGYAWAQQHGSPLTKADLANAMVEYLICQQQTQMLNPLYGTILWGNQPATW